MSPREDLEKIRQAGKLLEGMENKYEDKIVDFGKAVHDRHPAKPYERPLNGYRYLTTGDVSLYLEPGFCTEDVIAFRDHDYDIYPLPISWLEDPEAWHVKAAEDEAAYQAKHAAAKAAQRGKQITDLKAKLAKLEGTQ